MRRDTDHLSRQRFDLLVVGGGIFGVCAAWEAASRGLTVALLERSDFAGATTANSYKIAHGGMRYLQQADLPRVRRSSAERSALLRVAPHLVRPIPILVPAYGHGLAGKGLLRAGFTAYDLLTLDRNAGIRDPSRHIPPTRLVDRREALRLFPGLPSDRLTGGAIFHDGQMYSPPRLALAFLRSACEAGAEAANYAEVRGFLRDDGRVVGVEAFDLLAGRRFEVLSRMVLNATGPWASRLLKHTLGVDLSESQPVFSRDVGLVTRRRLPGGVGLACRADTKDADAVVDRGGRHLFLLPWRDCTLVGVWHKVHAGAADTLQVEEEELRHFLREANDAYPALELRQEDVCTVNTGLILFGDAEQEEAEHSFGKRSLLLDHGPHHGLEGLVTLVGVRATMARALAERSVDLALRKLGRPETPSSTTSTPVHGGDFASFEELSAEIGERAPWLDERSRTALAHNHGSRFSDVLELCADEELRATLDGTAVLRAEVVHAVQDEMARTVGDVAFRRTDLGTACHPGEASLRACGRLVARELDWPAGRLEEELETLRAHFRSKGAIRDFRPATATAGAVGTDQPRLTQPETTPR